MRRKLCFALALGLMLTGSALPEEALPGEQPQPAAQTAQAAEEAPQAVEAPKPEANAESADEKDARNSGENAPEEDGDAIDAPADPEDGGAADAPVDAPEDGGESQDDGGNDGAQDADPGEGGDAGQDGGADADDKPSQGEDKTVPEDAEAWFEGEDGIVAGKLSDVIERLKGDETVYLRAEEALLVRDVPVARLSDVKLLPDEKVFKGREAAVRLSEQDPAQGDAEAVALSDYKDADEDETRDLYIWVEVAKAETPEEPAEPEQPDKPADEGLTLTVEAQGFESAAWLNEAPEFALSGIPEDAKNWCYAAIIYDERIIMLSGDTYVPEAEGVYTLRFAMLDEVGDIVDATEKMTLWLDCTPPWAMAEPDQDRSYTLTVSATDDMSGVEALSLDGGESWIALEDGESYTYDAGKKTTLDAGMVQIRDHAGNIWQSPSPITLEKAASAYYGGGGGGGGGGGDGAPAKTHAKGEGEDEGEYDALRLTLPEDPMAALTVDGEELALTLALEQAQGPDAPLGQALFTASLERWFTAAEDDAHDGDDAHDQSDAQAAPDTLVLTAEPEIDLGDAFTYAWRFNGEVARLLSNSGIRYLALKVGDDVVAFPTQGFIGGAKYTELKMLGVSTRRFDYTITMRMDLDPAHVSATSEWDYSGDCDMTIRAEVENMAYELSASTQSAMYFYDVYLGPGDMLARPFGGYLDAAQSATD